VIQGIAEPAGLYPDTQAEVSILCRAGGVHDLRAVAVPRWGIVPSLRELAVKTTYHIPTMDGASSSGFSNAALMIGTPSVRGCQVDGLTNFVETPHCAMAVGIVTTTSTRALIACYYNASLPCS
jgi:hypothetical protein